ncbi:MAG: hypothetical protein NW205_12515 [Hyphomicrobiaceae bacterium]|nr:hypothetical protein [Hyphomicrobiaceae bacterium]
MQPIKADARSRPRRRCSLFVASVALAIGGCSAGDVQFEGKLFEMAGIGQTTERRTPKLAERAPLVVPPDLNRLPQPGSAEDPTDVALASINDPDRQAQIDPAILAKQQAEYCAKTYDLAKLRGDPDADQIVGPAGPCRKSALGGMGSLFGGSSQPQP